MRGNFCAASAVTVAAVAQSAAAVAARVYLVFLRARGCDDKKEQPVTRTGGSGSGVILEGRSRVRGG